VTFSGGGREVVAADVITTPGSPAVAAGRLQVLYGDGDATTTQKYVAV